MTHTNPTKSVQFSFHASEQIAIRFVQFGLSESIINRIVTGKVDKNGLNSGEYLIRVATSKVKISLPDGSNGDTVLAAIKVNQTGIVVKTVMLRRSSQITRLGNQHHDQPII